MTNEQLKILLESQALLLKEALEKAVELMPLTADREMEYYHPSSDRKLLSTSGYIDLSAFDQKPTGRYLTLIPLYEALETLQGQIDDLTPDFVTIESGS